MIENFNERYQQRFLGKINMASIEELKTGSLAPAGNLDLQLTLGKDEFVIGIAEENQKEMYNFSITETAGPSAPPRRKKPQHREVLGPYF